MKNQWCSFCNSINAVPETQVMIANKVTKQSNTVPITFVKIFPLGVHETLMMLANKAKQYNTNHICVIFSLCLCETQVMLASKVTKQYSTDVSCDVFRCVTTNSHTVCTLSCMVPICSHHACGTLHVYIMMHYLKIVCRIQDKEFFWCWLQVIWLCILEDVHSNLLKCWTLYGICHKHIHVCLCGILHGIGTHSCLQNSIHKKSNCTFRIYDGLWCGLIMIVYVQMSCHITYIWIVSHPYL